MTLSTNQLPAGAAAACRRLRAELAAALGDDLVAVWLHGGTTFPDRPLHPGDLDICAVTATVTPEEREPAAWTRWQLGKLYWSVGRVGAAAEQYRSALAIFPGYVYALDALAQAESARGNLRHSILLESRAVDTVPLPQFAATLNDLYRTARQPARANRRRSR